MIWWGSKWPISAMVGSRPYSAPPCPPLGAAPNIWAMVLNQTRGESVGGGVQGVPSPWGNSLLPGTPWDVGTPPGDFFDQNQKKEAKLSKLSNFSVTFSKTVPSAPLYTVLHKLPLWINNFGKNCIFFGKFVNKYALKRLKYGILGCFRGVEGAAKKLVFRKFPRYAPEPDPR